MKTKNLNTARMPKSYMLDVLNDYFEMGKNINVIIQTSGYKNTHIAQKLKVPLSTFYQKKRHNDFTPEEVYQIVTMIEDDDDTDMEDLEEAKASRNDEKTSLTEFLAYAKANRKHE